MNFTWLNVSFGLLMTLTFITATLTFTVHSDPEAVRHEIHSRVKRQSTPQKCNLADIIFVLDSSGSIKADNWVKILNFTKSVVSGFEIGADFVQIGVNYYGNRATKAFDLNEYDNINDVYAAIDAIPWLDQNTNTSGGIRLMANDMFTEANGARGSAPWLGIVITDGVSTRDPQLTVPEAKNAKDKGILMFAIGITDAIDRLELNAISSDPDTDYVFEADDFDALVSIRESVVSAACRAASECSNDGDLVVLLDASGSVGPENFELAKAFIAEIVLDSNIDTGDARLGLLTYSDDVQIAFQLNTYDDRIPMSEAVLALPYTRGTTNTGLAIQVARETMFTSQNGNRNQFRDTIVVFTDGQSNDIAYTLQQAKLAKQDGITLLVVAVTSWVNRREIELMVTYPPEANSFQVDSFADIETIRRPLRNAVCNDGAECTQSTCANGGTCVDAVNFFYCQCPVGFAGDRCQYQCTEPADIALIIQASSSIGETQYYDLLDFSKAFVRNLNIFSGQHRIAMETYASTATTRFNLNEFSDTESLMMEIDYLYVGGITNTRDALENMNDNIFDNLNGNRNSAVDAGVLVSDGFSLDRNSVFSMATTTHNNDIGVFSLGRNVKGEYSRRMLKGITSDPDDMNYFESRNLTEMLDAIPLLLEGICKNDSPCDSDPCLNGGVCVPYFNAYECQCPTDWTGINCEKGCSGQIDLVFVIDSSGSIRQNRFKIVLDFIYKITSQLEVREDRVRIGVVTYSDVATNRFVLNRFSRKEDVLHAIATLPYSRGRTNAADALQMLMDEMFIQAAGDRITVPNVALVFTDGLSNVAKSFTVPRAIQARVEGTHIMVVSVENDENNLELKGMSSDPDTVNLFNVNSYADLATIVDRVTGAMCDDFNECDSSPCQNNGICVDGLGQYLCICQGQWSGVNCQRSCRVDRDVVFLLDASGSVDYDYDMAQQLAREIIQGLNFNSGLMRVGMITFQSSEQVAFELNSYTSKLEVLNAVAFVNDNTEDGTNTAAALDTMTLDSFSSLNGDRSNVPNIGVVVTDGRSNVNRADTVVNAQIAKNNDIRLLAVGLGSDVDVTEIDGIASSPSSINAFFLETVADLENTANLVLDQICQ